MKSAACMVFFFVVLSVSAQMPELPDIFSGKNNFEEPLPPDEAFRLSLFRDDSGDFIAHWDITDGYYLYRDKMKVDIEGSAVAINPPDGRKITDEFFGETWVFRHAVDVPFTMNPEPPNSAVVRVSYQGCADLGVCYPPITKVISLASVTSVTLPSAAGPPVSEQFEIAGKLHHQNLFIVVVSFLGFGLLLALTPCVLPMIPILSSMITQSGSGSTARAFTLSLSYVLAMALTYAVVGVIVGITGGNLQVWFQMPPVLLAFTAVFVLLALSMFGFYELKVPARVQNYFSKAGAGRKGSVTGAAVMGGASALIVGPCVTPPLVGALLFIAQTGSAVTGGLALFSLGLGMGIPLLAVGTSLGRWLPKPGEALNMTKNLFGVLLLGVAIWLLDRILPAVMTQVLSGVLLVMTAVYLLGSGGLLSGWKHFRRGAGVIVLAYGLMLLIGAAAGGSSFLRPLEPLAGAEQAHGTGLSFTRVGTVADFERVRQSAVAAGRPVLLDFYADWCVTCKEMEAFTFSRREVRQVLSGVVLVQADVTANRDEDKVLLEHFDVFGPPAILFFDTQGKELVHSRVVGFMPAEEFKQHVRRTLGLTRVPLSAYKPSKLRKVADGV